MGKREPEPSLWRHHRHGKAESSPWIKTMTGAHAFQLIDATQANDICAKFDIELFRDFYKKLQKVLLHLMRISVRELVNLIHIV